MSTNNLQSVPNGNPMIQHSPPRTYQVVVASTPNMGIGKEGKLPWKLPSDLKFFKEITMATSDPVKKNAIIMGRRTWESIPSKHRPLPGRLNVVLTRGRSSDIVTEENVVTCGSMTSALELLASSPYCFSIENVFVIGGGQILRCYHIFLLIFTLFFVYIGSPKGDNINLFYLGMLSMHPAVMLSILRKSSRILTVILSSLLLIPLCFTPGTHPSHLWRTAFDILL